MERIRELIKKYQEGKATPEECVIVERHFLLTKEKRPIPENEAYKQEVYDNLDKQYGLRDHKPGSFKYLSPFVKYSAAAIVILALSIGGYFYLSTNTGTSDHPSADGLTIHNDIEPGGNKAILTLADGRTIDLSTEKSGIIVGNEITTYSDGTSVLENGESKTEYVLNSISTPIGGQYQITLSDGTKVWLNAASTLTYPTNFTGTTRQVEITGEAYFEVSEDKAHPFIVKSADQEVEVLGTHFNINAYADEQVIRTTLAVGRVKVSTAGSFKILSPGEQAVSGQSIMVKQVNVAQALGWKNGRIEFADSDIQSIMRMLARWYDIDVQYQGTIKYNSFGGSVSRSKSLSQVLEVLEKTGDVHFKIEGREVTVMP